MIRTVIFDLGGVIVPLDFARGYAAIEAACGCPAAEVPIRLGATDLVRRFETGRLEPEAFAAELSALFGMHPDFDEFCRLWSSIFPPHTLIPDALVRGLGANYRLVLLSNTNAIHWRMIRENYPIVGHFDEYVLSYEVGALKPSPAIYAAAIRAAQCRPEECFFTDDIPAYVEGARQSGIDAVAFTGANRLEMELRARGVGW
jgi:glucose-1-phosphatase